MDRRGQAIQEQALHAGASESITMLDFERSRIVRGLGFYVRISLAERLRAARHAPQAVVKVISYGRGAKGVARCFDYISRKGELPLETETGDWITGHEEQKALVRNWSRDFGSRERSRDSVHIAFSMPKGSDPETLREAVRRVLANGFSGHESVFAIHTDRPHPHAHAVIKMRSRATGRQLRLNRPELYKLREAFAEAAREQGVELAASPRATRGVGTKGLQQTIYQLKRKKIVPNVEKQAAKELLSEVERGRVEEKPWEAAMRRRNELERNAYRDEAARLRATARTDLALREDLLKAAVDLENFSRSMPKAKTRRQFMIEKSGLERFKSPEKENGLER